MQLVTTKTPYDILGTYLKPNHGKKALKNFFDQNTGKTLIYLLILQKHINLNKNSFQPIGYPDARKTIGKSKWVKKLV